jgi:hypothetical protein
MRAAAVVLVLVSALRGGAMTPVMGPAHRFPPVYGIAAGSRYQPIVAAGTSRFLAVWSDDRAPGRREVYASRLDATGAPLDPDGIRIGGFPASIESIASSGDEFIVAWIQDAKLFVSVIDKDGNASSPLLVTTTWVSHARLAWNGSFYAVAYIPYAFGVDYPAARVRLLDRSGAAASGDAILGEGPANSNLAIAGSPGRFLVAIDNQRAVTSRSLLRDDFPPPDSAPRSFAGPTQTIVDGSADVVLQRDDAGFIAVWPIYPSSIAVRHLDQNGAPAGDASIVPVQERAFGLTVNTTAQGTQIYYRTSHSIESVTLVQGTSPVRSVVRTTSPNSAVIASNMMGSIVVWIDNRFDSTGPHDQVFSAVLGPSTSIGGDVLVSSGLAVQSNPRAAAGGGHVLAVWMEEREQKKLVYGLLDSDGAIRRDAQTLSAGLMTGIPAVDSDGTNFLVVWAENVLASPTGTTYVTAFRGCRISSEGEAGAPFVIDVVEGFCPFPQPRVAWNGEYHFVVYNTGSRSAARRIRPDGTVIDSGPITLSGLTANDGPVLAWNGTEFYALTFRLMDCGVCGEQLPQYGLSVGHFSRELNLSGSRNDLPLTAFHIYAPLGDVAIGGSGVAAAWQASLYNPPHVTVALFQPSFMTADFAAPAQPHVAWDGASFIVAIGSDLRFLSPPSSAAQPNFIWPLPMAGLSSPLHIEGAGESLAVPVGAMQSLIVDVSDPQTSSDHVPRIEWRRLDFEPSRRRTAGH